MVLKPGVVVRQIPTIPTFEGAVSKMASNVLFECAHACKTLPTFQTSQLTWVDHGFDGLSLLGGGFLVFLIAALLQRRGFLQEVDAGVSQQ